MRKFKCWEPPARGVHDVEAEDYEEAAEAFASRAYESGGAEDIPKMVSVQAEGDERVEVCRVTTDWDPSFNARTMESRRELFTISQLDGYGHRDITAKFLREGWVEKSTCHLSSGNVIIQYTRKED